MNAALTFAKKNTFTAKQVVNDFLTYVKKPLYIAEDVEMSKIEKFQYLFKILLCNLALLPILIPIIYFTKQLTGAKSSEMQNTWEMYLIVVAIAPIIEEIIFRGALYYKRSTIAIVFSILMALFVKYAAINELIHLHIGFVYVASVALIPLIYYATASYDEFLMNFWAKNFKFVFHFVAISFGLIHLTNYSEINNYLFALPLVSAQLISGYVLGFVRMKLGFGYGVALHAAWNFIAGFGLLIVLLAKVF
jgi:membrane protease YdiL (CAAX protease family)